MPSRIFALVVEIAFSAFSTNFSRASALLATDWSALTTNVLASALTAWNCSVTFLAPSVITCISSSSALLGRSSSL